MATCVVCGKQNEPDARFCSACGSALAGEKAPRETRKTVTVLFSDVAGSTALGERLDPEAMRKAMARYFQTARRILEHHGATVEKFIGDAVMAVFGIPRVHEDDALRAVRAALELRDVVTELELRIGVNTGDVVAGGGETLVTGDAVNVAKRLEQAAASGEVLLGERTYRLTRGAVEVVPLEPLEAKGKAEPVPAYRLVAIAEGAPAFPRRLDTAFVGRSQELAQLQQAYARAVREQSCHLFTLLGPPGIGKSRLCQEFVDGVADSALVVRGHCLPYGDGITYWPLVEILRELGEPAHAVQLLEGEPDARRIVNDVLAGVGLAEGSVRPEETNRAVRKLLEALAREKPLVVLLDDLQWAEQTFLDLVEHVADLSRDAPLLLVCPARAELLDVRHGWGGGKHNATTLLLEPLSDGEADALITNLLADAQLDDAARERITAAAEGNPLFVEQMLAMLSENAGGEARVPPTIQALLAARLDRLEPDELDLLECAAVVGKEFWTRAIVELGADPAVLDGLVRKELIRPHRSTAFTSDDAYRFRHQLIQDAAYDAIPKERRAALHEGFANWLQVHLSQFDEIVGYHVERAYGYRAELGEPAPELAQRGGRLLGAAGLRAADRADLMAAINLLSRAAALLDPDDDLRLELLPHLGYAYFDVGELDRSGACFDEAAERAARAGRPVTASRARVGRHAVNLMVSSSMSEVRDALGREIAALEELEDHNALAEAYREAAKVESHLGRTEAADRLFAHAAENARLGGNRRVEADVLLWRLAMQCWGYLPASAGLRETEKLLEQGVTGLGEAFVLIVRGRYRALQGDVAGGRADVEAGRSLLRDYGAAFYIAGSGQEHGELEREAGEPARAEVPLREAYDMYCEMGGGTLSSLAAAMLGRVVLEQGRIDEADELAAISAATSASDDVANQIEWRTARTGVLAARDELIEAESVAREAVVLAEQTDFLEMHARALLSLAGVLAHAGRADEIRPILEEAIRLYERKESVPAAERARARLRDLASLALPTE